jgi:hypothetical protein
MIDQRARCYELGVIEQRKGRRPIFFSPEAKLRAWLVARCAGGREVFVMAGSLRHGAFRLGDFECREVGSLIEVRWTLTSNDLQAHTKVTLRPGRLEAF